MREKSVENLLEEKTNRTLRNRIYKIIDEEAGRFHILKDYTWIRLFSSSDYRIVIKIVKDKKPVKDQKFLECIAYRLYRELGIKHIIYDDIVNKGKFQALHY